MSSTLGYFRNMQFNGDQTRAADRQYLADFLGDRPPVPIEIGGFSNRNCACERLFSLISVSAMAKLFCNSSWMLLKWNSSLASRVA